MEQLGLDRNTVLRRNVHAVYPGNAEHDAAVLAV